MITWTEPGVKNIKRQPDINEWSLTFIRDRVEIRGARWGCKVIVASKVLIDHWGRRLPTGFSSISGDIVIDFNVKQILSTENYAELREAITQAREFLAQECEKMQQHFAAP